MKQKWLLTGTALMFAAALAAPNTNTTSGTVTEWDAESIYD